MKKKVSKQVAEFCENALDIIVPLSFGLLSICGVILVIASVVFIIKPLF